MTVDIFRSLNTFGGMIWQTSGSHFNTPMSSLATRDVVEKNRLNFTPTLNVAKLFVLMDFNIGFWSIQHIRSRAVSYFYGQFSCFVTLEPARPLTSFSLANWSHSSSSASSPQLKQIQRLMMKRKTIDTLCRGKWRFTIKIGSVILNLTRPRIHRGME